MTKDEYQHYMDLAVKANEKMYRQIVKDSKEEEKKSMTKKLYNAGVDIKIIKDTTGFNEKQIKNICM